MDHYTPGRLWSAKHLIARLEHEPPSWGDHSAERLAVAALKLGHESVFEWLIAHNYFCDQEVFELLLSDAHLQLAERVKALGFPVALDHTDLVRHRDSMPSLRWAIQNMSPAGRARQPILIIHHLEQHNEYGLIWRLLSPRYGSVLTVPEWLLIDRVHYPKLTDDQADWVPTFLGRRLQQRRDNIEASLGYYLPPNLVRYIVVSL